MRRRAASLEIVGLAVQYVKFADIPLAWVLKIIWHTGRGGAANIGSHTRNLCLFFRCVFNQQIMCVCVSCAGAVGGQTAPIVAMTYVRFV